MMMSRAVVPLGVSVTAAWKRKLACSWTHSCAVPKTLCMLPSFSYNPCKSVKGNLCVCPLQCPYLFVGSMLTPLVAHRGYVQSHLHKDNNKAILSGYKTMSVHPDVCMSALNQHPPFTCPFVFLPPWGRVHAAFLCQPQTAGHSHGRTAIIRLRTRLCSSSKPTPHRIVISPHATLDAHVSFHPLF